LGLSKQEVKDFYDESIKMLTRWLIKYTKAVAKGVKKPETEVKIFSGKYGVMGIIDAIYTVNGKVYIIDYKTGKKDTITQDIKVQMSIYALLYQDKFGERPYMVSIDFLKPQTIRRFKVTDNVINYAINMCQTIHAKTLSDNESDYPCMCGGWCQHDILWKNEGY